MFYHKKAWAEFGQRISNMNDNDTITVKELKQLYNQVGREMYEKHNKPTDEEIVQLLSEYANTMLLSPTKFAIHVISEHRTIQQNFFDMFLACIEQWAKLYDNDMYDERNAGVVRLSKQIIDCLNK
jgi:hypothetical protein